MENEKLNASLDERITFRCSEEDRKRIRIGAAEDNSTLEQFCLWLIRRALDERDSRKARTSGKILKGY